MTRLEDVLIPIIEQIPTYMRPPYFDISDEVLATMSELGYKVITASIDTKDYEHDTKDGVLVSYNKFLNELDAGGSIVLSHDTHYWTGGSLVERMLIEISERGLTGMFSSPSFLFLHGSIAMSGEHSLMAVATTVGDCLGEPLDAWYRPA
jgi:peptidoglycan/xylan/chitin deacetylase (PgdA/CDA1 family)